ncbi:AAA family ATPase [Burkholderiaceae bacterium FT117]|uniref:bifunctional aminoglycoside phosphotransferase/ATP-binding protein n=1 Tax=Zeimonas sediminis TaxID=2944268 RepID=UPI002342F47C|nr:bifunctional aminoglycoside phosphotransferase/ATP-binding protein [Zeimonas sediminis]MCM5570864.1 AAA family ATPase [Zeimonas sediminis]
MSQADPEPATAAAGARPPDGFAEALRRHLEASLGRPVRCIETHISWVLLDGEHAWKLKKPVRLGFLDFGSAEVRERFCHEELRLNRRLAPGLYLDVVPIRGSRDRPRIDGGGPPVDHAVRMRQFPAGALLDERLASGRLEPEQVDRLARRIADFHAAAPVAGPATEFGSAATIEAATSRVLDALAGAAPDPRIAPLRAWCEAEALRLRPEFGRRKAQGKVRECHGDLHLANAVVLGDDDVTAFDCIEFDPALRWIDLQSEVAFLVMDLLAHGRADLGFRFLDTWLESSGDHEGVTVLRYYLVYRALVRAMVAAIRAGQAARRGPGGAAGPGVPPETGGPRETGAPAGAPDYLSLAERLSRSRDPRLLITHGLSGSGKSHAARLLLGPAGAIRLRSDVERKRLFGLRALEPSAPRVPGGIYREQDTERTYARLLELAGVALDAGWPVIVDAAFLRAGERAAFRRAAQARGVPFAILRCNADPELLRARVAARGREGDDPSEADLSVLEGQLRGREPLQADELPFAIEVDSAGEIDPRALAEAWRARS